MIPDVRRCEYNGRVGGISADEEQILVTLLTRTRWATLGTARDNEPLASWVATVADVEPGHFLLHLSHLALHTRYLLANPRASLAFSEPDREPDRDPQTLARISLQGSLAAVARDSADYLAARGRYLAALPEAEIQFGLGDFYLMRFVPDSARFVPGFGRVHRLDRDTLAMLLNRN